MPREISRDEVRLLIDRDAQLVEVHVAAPGVPTCRPAERLRDVQGRVVSAGWNACVVVNDERIVLGLLGSAELEGDPEATVERSMRPEPCTFRPFVSIDDMAKYTTEHDLASAPITTSDGRLVGLLRREDAVRASEEG